MKTISILVPEHAVIQAVADPQYCFNAVNQFMVDSGKQPIFNIELVGAKREIKLNNGNFSVFPDKLLDEVIHTDLIFVPALFGDMNKAIEANKELLPFITEHYQNGTEVASLCVGAFLLASTGLLNGKKCSTHWGFYEQFNQLFPEVNIQNGSIVTDEQRIYTSGGANSY